MEQFETCVSTMMSFLKEENFSASVISLHRLCYQAIATYLSSNMLEYSPDIGYQWIEMHHSCWDYRKYTGFKHCIDQLNDVFLTGKVSLEHLSPRCSAYSLLSIDYKSILDRFISDTNCTDDRYRIACSRFLLYMQNNNISDISELTYESIIYFHNDDYHRVQKSKDTYEDLIRVFLRYLASINLCDVGLSLTLNKLLIDKIISIPQEDIHIYDCNSNAFEISWIQARSFISELKNLGYGKTVINSSEHILTLLYIFLQMHQVKLNERLLWYWYDNVKPLLGGNYKQHRRSLYQFMEYIKSGAIVTSVTGDPNAINAIDTMPDWIAIPLRNYLELLKREGWQPSTIAMHKSSNLRFCKYLLKIGICNFSNLTPEVIVDFNLQDNHNTSEGKAAYNCRIRSFIIYLFEQKLITNAYLYKALPTFVSNTVSIVQTLSKEEVSTIWSVDPEVLSPKALRDYAMVCIGLTMGFRACDIVSLRFDNINWKNRSICITQQKTGKLITMPMPVRTGNIIYRYIRDGRPKSQEPYIFIRHEAPYDRIQRGVCRSALKRFLNLPHGSKCKFHAVRKTFATQLLEGNIKTTLISDSLGHSTDDTVHKYLSLDESRMRLCAISMSDVGISYKGGAFHA